jgi:hypothetical protein
MEIVVRCSVRDCDFETTIKWPEHPDGELLHKSILHPSADPGSEELYDHHDLTRPKRIGASGHDPYIATINGQRSDKFIAVGGNTALFISEEDL